MQTDTQDIRADYWRAYFEWRAEFGLSDACMKELLAAIRVELAEYRLSPDEVRTLSRLAQLIEVELEDDRQTRHAA